MTVENYIKDLLYRQECIIVPGFGALITHSAPANIDEKNTFHPPKKILSFNRQLVKNDGLLANYIAGAEKIPYEKSMFEIHRFSEQLKSALAEEKEVVLDGIGVFVLEKGDKLQFQPFYNHNYLLDSFGMDPFIAGEIKREIYKKETEALEEKTSLVFSREKKRGVGPYLKYAAIGLLALGLSGALGMNWYSGQVEEHNFAAQREAESQLEGKIQEATFVIGNPLPEITFKVDVQSGKYHIVAGAFREKSNAVKKTRLLIEKGFHARQIGKNKYGLHQVVYSSYQNRAEALNALHNIQRTDNENAWLLVEKL